MGYVKTSKKNVETRRRIGVAGWPLMSAAVVAGSLITSACVAGPGPSSPMATHGTVKTPRGFVSFCSRNPERCSERRVAPRRASLTAEGYEQLDQVNRSVNRAVRYVDDQELYGETDYWTLPGAEGDCEDIALEKRRRLIELGWPKQSLLLTVAMTRKGTGHLVLTVATDKGDYVLDNLHQAVRPWASLDYRWLTRQSQQQERTWVWLEQRNGT